MQTSRIALVAGLAGALTAIAVACGGPGKGAAGDKGGGSGTGDDHPLGGGVAGAADAGLPPDAAPPAAPVTFVLSNTGAEELALNLDRGWGGVLLVWSGKPPKAKPILAFPRHCTMSCETVEEERCPLCVEPEKVADIRKAQKLEKIAPGAMLEVPWDGMAAVYQKTKGKRDGRTKKCECWSPAEVAAETYTVKACGLRLTKTVDRSTQLVCAEGQMTLPSAEPIRVELVFK